MKKFKKVVSLVLVAMIFLMIFVGCKNEDNNQNNNPTNQSSKDESENEKNEKETNESKSSNEVKNENENEEEEIKELEETTIKWYVICDGQPVDAPKVMDALEEKLKPINTKLDIQGVGWGEYTNKINLMFASGEPFDLFFAAAWLGLPELLSKGYVMDISEYIPEMLPNTYDKTIPKGLFEGQKVDGKYFGVPMVRIGTQENTGLIVREDMMEKYNIPETMDTYADIKPYLDQIRENEDFISPLCLTADMHNGAPSKIEARLNGIFVDSSYSFAAIRDDHKKFENYFAMPEVLDWFKLRYENVEAGNVNQDSLAEKANTTHLSEGMYAAQFHGGGEVNKSIINTKYGPNFKFKLVTFPFESRIIRVDPRTSISYTCKQPERAMMFLDLVNSDQEIFNMIAMGIEGEHWVMNDDGRWEYPEGVDASNVKYGGWRSYSHIFGNSALRYYSVDDDMEAYKKQEAFENSGTKTIPAIGFVFDQSTVKSDVAKVQSVCDEYVRALQNGALDPELHLPKFVDKLEEAGIDKVLDEMNKQLQVYYDNGGK